MHSLIVLCGGPWTEHEVSLKSWENVYSTTSDNAPFGVYKIVISREWAWVSGENTMTESEWLDFIQEKNGVVFSVLHGLYGEDGTLTRLLEWANIPFVGSGSASMKLAIDKQATTDMLALHGVQVPKTFVITDIRQIDSMDLVFPVIVKPRDEGSSVSLYKIGDRHELQSVLEKELWFRSEILVQEYIQGREFSCGVVELDHHLTPLLPTEIILTKGGLFDYTAKYSIDGCREVTPAEVSDQIQTDIQSMALAVHNLCGCRDISRTDVILHPTRGLFVLEINTLPGMTHTSFIPAQLQASGHSLKEFIGEMMNKYNQ